MPHSTYINQKSKAKTPTSLKIAWIIAITIGIALSLTTLPSVFVDGEVHPLTNDSFYHAARILEIAEDPTSTHAFDPYLHWPEGHWVTWPWAYDYLAGILSKALSVGNVDPAHIMAFYPLLWLIANITLVGLIAKDVLNPYLSGACMIAFATAPITLLLHGLGQIDHHSAELFWLLICMFFTGQWLKSPVSSKIPIALGALLAVATAFHNILFLLQIPFLACLFLSRIMHNAKPPKREAKLFSASLIFMQVLVLLPSHEFATFDYVFYYHSWFHLHVACLTSLAVLAICSERKAVMWWLLLLGVGLSLPALDQVLYGLTYVKADTQILSTIRETLSPFGSGLSIKQINYFYSGAIWFLPICLGYILYELLVRKQQGVRLGIMVFAVFGLLLLSSQGRFNNFGYFFLIIIPLLLIQDTVSKNIQAVVAFALFFGAYTFSLSLYLIPPKIGSSVRYDSSLPLILKAKSVCESEPGLLLSEMNWGSFLRYQTRCPLIANNFFITRKELDYAALSAHYLAQTPEKMRAIAPKIRYVFVSDLDKNELGTKLLSDKKFEGFNLLEEIRYEDNNVLGRLYSVEPIDNQ